MFAHCHVLSRFMTYLNIHWEVLECIFKILWWQFSCFCVNSTHAQTQSSISCLSSLYILLSFLFILHLCKMNLSVWRSLQCGDSVVQTRYVSLQKSLLLIRSDLGYASVACVDILQWLSYSVLLSLTVVHRRRSSQSSQPRSRVYRGSSGRGIAVFCSAILYIVCVSSASLLVASFASHFWLILPFVSILDLT